MFLTTNFHFFHYIYCYNSLVNAQKNYASETGNTQNSLTSFECGANFLHPYHTDCVQIVAQQIIGNKTWLSSLVVQDTDAIKFRKVVNFQFNFRIKKSPEEAFSQCYTHNECFWILTLFYTIYFILFVKMQNICSVQKQPPVLFCIKGVLEVLHESTCVGVPF